MRQNAQNGETAKQALAVTVQDRANVTSFFVGALLATVFVIQQASIQAGLDALTKLTDFDISTFYFPLFAISIFSSVWLAYELDLKEAGAPSRLDSFCCCSGEVAVVVWAVIISILAAVAQGSFTVAVQNLVDPESDFHNRTVFIVSLCIAAVTVPVVSVFVGVLFFLRNKDDNSRDRPIAFPFRSVLSGASRMVAASKEKLKEFSPI